jgi:YfiH family protein
MSASALLETAPRLMHAFTDRFGGGSAAPYDTLNLAYHVGDDALSVDVNHARLAERLGYNPRRLVHMRQIHSDRIVRCTPEMGFGSRPECDALITDVVGQPLMVMVADCTPVLLHDPRHRAIAAVHAGRAGALKNIVGKTVDAMRAAFGTAPEELLASLGPSIGVCCYEIGPETAEAVAAAGCAFALEPHAGRFRLDVNRILIRQLEAAGLPSAQIDPLGTCTSCNRERYFSYRAAGGTTGRQAGIIMLK